MCHELCAGSILCDEDTYHHSRKSFSYSNDGKPIEIIIKGTPDPVQVYTPICANAYEYLDEEQNIFSVELVGREVELLKLETVFNEWRVGNPKLAIITAPSGYGKTFLTKAFHESFIKPNKEIISW